MKNKKILRRVLLLGLTLLLVCGALVSCGGDSSADYNWIEADGDDATAYFSRILPLNAEAREKFVAASRGYNMSAEGFNDANVVIGEVKPVDLEAAKKALEGVTPDQAASKDKFNSFKDNLTVEQVTQIVEKMKNAESSKVDLETSQNPMVWLGWLLRQLTKITGGYYVLALFIFAVIIELLMLVFGIRQQKNSIKQARLSPKERAIRKKYAGRNDQVSMRRMQEEIQKLYQDEGFNPMGGCLPLLIQMPILIMLYNIVIDPLRYVLGKSAGLSTALSTFVSTSRAAGGLGVASSSGRGTIELLSKLNETPGALDAFRNFSYFSNAGECADQLANVSIPNFRFLGMNTGLVPTQDWWPLVLVPILTFGFYFASMKLNRKFSYQPAMAAQNQQMGCSNNMMDITMPLMSVYIAFITPAAIGIYWIFKCVISTLKQFILHKAMPLPTFTEEEYKQAEKEMKARSKGQRLPTVVVAEDGQQYRSLHHIDDEDDLPPRGTVITPAPAKEKQQPDAASKNGGAQKMGAPMKEDRKNNQKK